MNSPTKTEDTKIFYINRVKQFMIRAYLETLNDEDFDENNATIIQYKGEEKIALNLINTVVWAVRNLSNEVKQSTWKLYRNALIYYAEIECEKGNIGNKKLEKIKELLRKTRSLNTKGGENTSSKKKKSFNLKEIKAIDEALKNSRSKWANATRIFIRAGKYTGLRPSEWKTAKLSNNNKVLVVKNAKHTNGRSFGEERKLSLNHLEKKQIDDIELHLKLSNRMEENNIWDLYYTGCSSLLRRVVRKLWKNKKKYPTLYSCRHQFAADMKASGCTKREVAALMGHSSEKTAESHYGKKIHGTRGRKPNISKVDVALVRKSNKKKFTFD